MKSFQTQTHYEVLEISVGATVADVKSAYERLSNLYSDEQVVLYGLIDANLASALRARLKEAHDVLVDDSRRDAYDVKIGLPPRAPVVKKPAPVSRPLAPAPSWSDNYTFVSPASAPPPPPTSNYTYVVAAPSLTVPTAPMPPKPVLAPAPPPAPPPPEEPPPKRLGLRMLPPAEPPPEAAAEPPVEAPPEEAVAPVVEAPPPVEAPPVELSQEPGVDSAPTFVPVADESALVVSKPAVAREFRVEARPKPYEIPEGVEINGDLLRQVRLARGLTLAQLADRTRISTKHLENVEGDRYDSLPAGVYLRGILMNLARELGLDGLRVSKSYLTFVDAGRSKG